MRFTWIMVEDADTMSGFLEEEIKMYSAHRIGIELMALQDYGYEDDTGLEWWESPGRHGFWSFNMNEVLEAWHVVLTQILEIGDEVLLFYEGTGDGIYGGVHSAIRRVA